MKASREKIALAYIRCYSHFIYRARGASSCKRKYERAERITTAMVVDRSSNNKSYQNPSERSATAENYQKSTPAAWQLGEFLSRRCFPFFGKLLSSSCTAVISFLFALLAEINRAYNKVIRRRNGVVPSRGKWIAAGEDGAILTKKSRAARKNIRTRLIKSFLIVSGCHCPCYRCSVNRPAALAAAAAAAAGDVERHFYGPLLSEQLRVYSEFPFVLFFTVLFASPASGFWHSGSRLLQQCKSRLTDCRRVRSELVMRHIFFSPAPFWSFAQTTIWCCKREFLPVDVWLASDFCNNVNFYKIVAKVKRIKVRLFIFFSSLHFHMCFIRSVLRADIFYDEKWKYNFTLQNTLCMVYILREKSFYEYPFLPSHI